MRRSTLNFVVDLASLLAMFGLIATGLLIRFVLPPGTGGRHGHGPAKVVWGFGRHDWGDVHYWIAAGLGVLVLVHVALHWTWVCNTVARLVSRSHPGDVHARGSKRKNAYGVGVLALIGFAFAGFLWLAWTSVEVEPTPPNAATANSPASHEPGHHRQAAGTGEGSQWGQMTLAELEATTGIAASVFIEALGLPADVPRDERLGRLGKQYGFRPSSVRDIVAGYVPGEDPQRSPE